MKRKPLFFLALFTTFFAFTVILKGAYTRLVDAGLGCPDWPGCYGFLKVPTTDEHIAIANSRFPDAKVEVHKGWPEMIHRYLAGTLGLLILSLMILSYLKRRRFADQPILLPTLIFLLVILQALFGMWTVTLKLWPQVVTAHLLGGFATLSLLWMLILKLQQKTWLATNPNTLAKLKNLVPLSIFLLIVVILQISLGGWMSANYAALSCPDFPTCQGRWWPDTDFQAGFNFWQQLGPNYLGGKLDNAARVAIHLSHRLGAVLLIFLMIILSIRLARIDFQPLKKLGFILLGIFILQICLGISNVIWHLPLAVAVAHNGVGALLLLACITLTYQLITTKTNAHG